MRPDRAPRGGSGNQMSNRKHSIAAALVAAALGTAPDALAYIDPGTGSMVIQSAIAALVGIAFAFRNGFRNTLRWFGELFRKDDAPADPPSKDEPPSGPAQ